MAVKLSEYYDMSPNTATGIYIYGDTRGVYWCGCNFPHVDSIMDRTTDVNCARIFLAESVRHSDDGFGDRKSQKTQR